MPILLRLLALAMVFLPLALLPWAAQAVSLDPRPVTLPGPDGLALQALLLLPEATVPGIPVIALHGCAGLAARDGSIRLGARERDWATRLLAAGHPVLFPESFLSRGLGTACGVTDFPAGGAVRGGDALAAAAWAQAQPWAAPGGALLLGWSHGGTTVLAAAATAPPGLLRGGVAFYPGCGPSRRARTEAQVPLLLLLGARDDWTPPAPCRGWAAMQAAGRVELEEFPTAGHGFDAPGNAPPRARDLPDGRRVTAGADPAARAVAIPRAMAFFEQLSR
ncbi:dienelactone hydrolase family protein [Roseomonas sp. 18066]|uniref:dienelactone hydrolase family protein n=1 Tax=Roseomonas sp. 18066 TaxID=2681412 RepID=UPI0013580E98|nr:dienelactone hydrolase family protein [Roseomonas sp. 18066]